MTGRDLRNFVFNHRTDDTDRLVKRVTEGITPQGYKAVDYEKLKQIAAEKKFQGQEKLVKVKKIQQASKQSKEQNLVKSHKAVWRKEFLKLNTQRKKLQAEIDLHMRDNVDDDDLFLLFRELDDQETSLSYDFQQFKKNTADPVWTLREDLQYWVAQYRSKGGVIPGEHPDVVRNQIDLVRNQQTKILERLKNEETALEQELDEADLPSLFSLHTKKQPHIQTGIPEEAFDLECPDHDLKTQVLQEFILIDDKYTEKVVELEDTHAEALGSETGDWSSDDHLTFIYVIEQYGYDVPNRRTLYIDRLRKHLPHKSRAQIVSHEEWYTLYRHFLDRERAMIHDWMRDRRELLNRAKLIFHEACQAAERQEERLRDREEQRGLCEELYEKVRQWRERKLELLQLEQQVAQRRHAEMVEQMKEEEEREKKKREKDRLKARVTVPSPSSKRYKGQRRDEISIMVPLGEDYERKIEERHRELAEQRRADAEKERLQLEQLREEMAAQAERDAERVKFREEEYNKKLELQKLKKEEKLEAEAERDRVLEALREQVRPHVEGDLLRLWSDTETVKQKHKRDEAYINIQQPLYQVPGFNSKQITADPRNKLESELRNAGLMHNEYARQMVAAQAPKPKPQMESSLFK